MIFYLYLNLNKNLYFNNSRKTRTIKLTFSRTSISKVEYDILFIKLPIVFA